MSVKNFKFVSPGVFINEIDNSFVPKTADAIGPVVIGRSRKGLAMQPIKVESYSDFVTMFGDTVPGMGGGDVYRDGNYQSPMYGTYAAKAFLRSNVAPLTYVRLLGQETADGNTAGGDAAAGWKTTNAGPSALADVNTNGGAWGLFVFPSKSVNCGPNGGINTKGQAGTGALGAIFYLDDATIKLSGTYYAASGGVDVTSAAGHMVTTNDTGLFTLCISGSSKTTTASFGFDDTKETFIRKKFNTNPQLCSDPGTFYANASAEDYWLGETFEQELRDGAGANLGDLTTNSNLVGIVLALGQSGAAGVTSGKDPSQMKGQPSREATAGWFISQDQGASGSYHPNAMPKLFRLLGRGHGEWLHKNVKVSIEQIKQSTTTITDYGTFSLVLRDLLDTDNQVVVLERYDNLTMDPTAPDYVARRIGDQYYAWDSVQRRLKLYGDYPNRSKYVRVEMNADADAGATDPALLPFGYFGPPKMKTVTQVHGTGSQFGPETSGPREGPSGSFLVGGLSLRLMGGAANFLGDESFLTASFVFPSVRLRNSASDGGLSDPTNAYFGMQTTRISSSTRADASVADPHRLWFPGFADDPSGADPSLGITGSAYVFSLDDVRSGSAGSDVTAGYYYESGSRNSAGGSATSGSYTNLLNAGYDRFTAPFWGGFDGWDILQPDPLRNAGMTTAATENNSYAYHTYRRAIDTVADPEFIDMNTLVAPGLTNDSLTVHMINVCEERGDALALIDLANVYIPAHEAYKSNRNDRIGTTPTNAATALKDRRVDSSYGATFYPWVQTRDEQTGQLVWIPPTVAMLGVLASSERKSQLWFAPAGFNRGGLTDGAAGIPVVNVSERLTSKERDTLYEARINPIASFPSTGIVVFGQKTLQERRSALDRINVRRLVIYLKKQISILSSQLLFDQNVQGTWNRFIGLVDPFLHSVKTQLGITDYRLILDSSTTTPDLVDQNIMYAKIMIKPARAIEFIAIDFVIMSTGASFDD